MGSQIRSGRQELGEIGNRESLGGLWIFKKIIDTIAKIATVYGLALIAELIFTQTLFADIIVSTKHSIKRGVLRLSTSNEKNETIAALMDKGKRNLDMAEILDSENFLALSEFPRKHLCSIIINRLYYGVYLIGKGKLLEKDNTIQEQDFLGHGAKNTIRNSSIKHNKNSKKATKLLWAKLYEHYSATNNNIYRICMEAIKLHRIRNHYDYRIDMRQDIALHDLRVAQEQKDYIIEALEKLQ